MKLAVLLCGLIWYSIADVCPSDLIGGLTSQYLFDRLTLCATDPFYMDFETCISQQPTLIRSNLEDLSTPCKACLSNFVDAVAGKSKVVGDSCATEPRSSTCLAFSGIRKALADFQTCSRSSLIYPSCSAQEVRRFAERGATRSIIEVIGLGSSDFASVNIPYTPCGLCYYQLGTQLSTAAQQNATVMAAIQNCRASSSLTDQCRNSLREYFDEFMSCSGFEAGRYGPECTSSELAAVAALEPYKVLTTCAFSPQDSSCQAMGSYFASIQSLSNPACTSCYMEFLDDLKNLRATLSAGSVCNNINSQNCLTWNAQQIQSLTKCTSGAR